MTRTRGLLLCACAVLACAAAGAARAGLDVGRDRGRRQDRRRRRRVLRHAQRRRPEGEPRLDHWDAANPTAIAGQAEIASWLPQAQAAGTRIIFAVSPMNARDLTATPRRAAQFAAFVTRSSRATFPTVKDYVIGNEPNQPRFWLPQFSTPASRSLPRRLPAGAGRLVRRAQGRRPDDQRDRDRPLAARKRPAASRRATSRARRCASCTTSASPTARADADQAADGRARLPPVPAAETAIRPSVGYAWPNAGLAEPRPDQAGGLGRVQRHRAADLRRAPQDRFEAAAGSTSTRSAGRSRPCRRWRRSTSASRRRHQVINEDDQATYYTRHDHARRVRPRRADAQLLPPGRRDRPRPLAERARARRRLAPALVRRGQADDRPDPRQLPGHAGRAGATRRSVVLPTVGVGEPQAAAAASAPAGASPRAPARRRTSAPGSSRPARRRRSSASGSPPAGRSRCSPRAARSRPKSRVVTFPSAGSSRGLYVYAIRMSATMNSKRATRSSSAGPSASAREAEPTRGSPGSASSSSTTRSASSRARCCASTRRRWPRRWRSRSTAPRSRPVGIRTSTCELERLPELLLAEANDEQLEYVSPIAEAELELVDAIVTIWSESNTRALTACRPGAAPAR